MRACACSDPAVFGHQDDCSGRRYEQEMALREALRKAVPVYFVPRELTSVSTAKDSN